MGNLLNRFTVYVISEDVTVEGTVQTTTELDTLELSVHGQIIRDNKVFLVQNIDLTGSLVIDAICEKHVLTDKELDGVREKPTNIEKVRSLLGILQSKSEREWDIFLQCLAEYDHEHIVRKLKIKMVKNPKIKRKEFVFVSPAADENDPGPGAEIYTMAAFLEQRFGKAFKSKVIKPAELRNLDTTHTDRILTPVPTYWSQFVDSLSNKDVKISLVATLSYGELKLKNPHIQALMNRATDNFFVGPQLFQSWKRYFYEFEQKCHQFIPSPPKMSHSFELPTAKITNVVADFSSADMEQRDVIGNIENIANVIAERSNTKLMVLVPKRAKEEECETISSLPGSVVPLKLKHKSNVQDLLDDSLWIFTNRDPELSWTSLQPLMSGCPQIVSSGTPLYSALMAACPEEASAHVWNTHSSESLSLHQLIDDKLSSPMESYNAAKKLRSAFGNSGLVQESFVNIATCLAGDDIVEVKVLLDLLDETGQAQNLYGKMHQRLNERLYTEEEVTAGDQSDSQKTQISSLAKEGLSQGVVQLKEGSLLFRMYVPTEHEFLNLRSDIHTGNMGEILHWLLLLLGEEFPECAITSDVTMTLDMETPSAYKHMCPKKKSAAKWRKRIKNMGQNLAKTLHRSATRGICTMLKWCLKKGVHVDTQDEKGNTALFAASNSGQEKAVEILLDNGSNVNHENKDGETVIFAAAVGKSKETLKVLIDNGADVNHENKNGETPIFAAASEGRTDCMQLLIEQGGDVNHRDKDGRTAIFEAAMTKKKEATNMLQNYGCSTTGTDKYGKTPISAPMRPKINRRKFRAEIETDEPEDEEVVPTETEKRLTSTQLAVFSVLCYIIGLLCLSVVIISELVH